MPMKILHILDHSIPLHSGYTFRTRAILNEQRARGWQTAHLTSPKQINCTVAEETVDGLHFYRSPAVPPGIGLLEPWRLMQVLAKRLDEVVKAERPDILHAHSPVLNALPAIQVANRRGLPVVYEVRAFWEDAAVDHGTTAEGSLRYRLTRMLESSALRRAHHVFTICEGLRGDMLGRGIAADKITVIPNAVNVEDFMARSDADPALRSQLGLDGVEVVGFIGSFYAYEGLDLLLAALPRLRAQRPRLKALLVGGGPQEQALKAQVARLGLQDAVVFTGRVPHAEVQRYYDLIDVLAYPRHPMRLTELVTPLKPLEAMAQQRLLVASDVGGHRELIRDGETGWLFKAGDEQALADALQRAFESRDDWARLRANGRRFVEQERTWSNSVERYRAVYERFCA